MLIPRTALTLVRQRLADYDSVAIVGPRQVGKTTLALEIVGEFGDDARYLDLEKRSDREQLLSNPDGYFSTYADKLIVLDEIQRVPELFQLLRSEIDIRRRAASPGGKFLLLGSASMELLRQSSESLAGRISFVELTPLSLAEAMDQMKAEEAPSTVDLDDIARTTPLSEKTSHPSRMAAVINALWLKGGFPPSYLRADDAVSLQWRLDFIQTYLERDIPLFGLRVASEQLDFFWRMLANDQGELFNAQRYAQALGVSGHTISRYSDILEKLLLVRRLRPWSRNSGKRLVKSPRLYVRDTGILHALLELRTLDNLRGHRVSGKSWEGFVIEALIGAAGRTVQPYFYRTAAGAEADLILEFVMGGRWAIEIKIGERAPDRGFYSACDDVEVVRRIVVHSGTERFSMSDGVEAMPLLSAMAEIKHAVSGVP